ncbi:MAG: aminopeptidase N [Pseudomonadales bacterium]|jgi:aminopeptidase N
MDAQETPVAINLADYRPPEFRTLRTDLTFDIREGETRVENRMHLTRVHPGDLVLDGQDLLLESVAVDGRKLGSNEYRLTRDHLTLFDVPDDCEVTVVTRIHPERNTALEGLYRSSGMYCTQCEAEGFRKITYYQDRPDVLSVFTTTILADATYPVLLSNGNLVASDTLDDGRRSVTWHDPFPKPSYLFALVAGDLALNEDVFVTASGREVRLAIYSEPHNIAQTDYAMDALKRAMRWDEETYGREYDLDVYMIVAVDDFNMGAMENKGLNIFNTSCILATPDTATDQGYQRVEAVVAHEYFHNWSGNRVTCRDWFQLSLKEGFTVFRDAQFSGDANSHTVKRIEDVSTLRAVQFAEDAGPLAHPVRPSTYIEISNFYTPTVYEKGAEVVGMVRTIVGAERFRAGADLYFDRHDGGAVTTEDFLAAMADASGVDLGQFQRWYDQAGTPELTVTSSSDGEGFELRIRQRCPATPGQREKAPFHVPVAIGLLDSSGATLVDGDLVWESDCEIERRGDTLLVHLKREHGSVRFPSLTAPPEVSFLRDFSAPVKVRFDRPAASLAFLAEKDPDGFAAWDALQTLLVSEIDRLGEGGTVSDQVLEVFERILKAVLSADQPSAESNFLNATKLAVPSESYLFEQVEHIDVERICGARDRLVEGLATEHRGLWVALRDTNERTGPYAPDPLGMSRRALGNRALGYLARTLDGSELAPLLDDAYARADNLTDRRAVLAAALDALPGASVTQDILAEFHERWQHEALVVNQWFQLQATSRHCDVSALMALCAHPAFALTNPNKVRAVLSAFAGGNARNFHVADGSGYRYIGQRILELDRINPQMAAALAKPLTRWRRYTRDRGLAMQNVLGSLAAAESLSTDLYEVVTKSLA